MSDLGRAIANYYGGQLIVAAAVAFLLGGALMTIVIFGGSWVLDHVSIVVK